MASSIPRSLAAPALALALASAAHAAPRRSIEATPTGLLPEARVDARGRGDELALSAYPGGPSLAAWRAAPRGPLSVLLTLPPGEVQGFLSPNALRPAGVPASETCVPPSYRWTPVSVGWERLSPDGDALSLEEHTVTFDPNRCRFTAAPRSVVRPAPLGVVNGEAALLAFRRGDVVLLLLPREARVAADEPSAVRYGALTRVLLAGRPGAALRLQAAFPAGALAAWRSLLRRPQPAASEPFTLDIELVDGALVVRRDVTP